MSRSWDNSQDPVVPLEGQMYGHPLAGLLWEGQFGKSSKTNGRKYPDGNALFFGTARKLCLCVFVGDKKAGNKEKPENYVGQVEEQRGP